ncbi:MAG TPA: hypothetical protein VFT50_13705 [Baekduia sp.]|nr:hypothetical protein [Baekduia sp.]
MNGRTLVALGTTLALTAGLTGASVASAAPSKVTIKERQKMKMKPNRYIQDGLRWDKDVYTVKSGGTLHVVDNVVSEGPHTVSIMRPQDLPRTAAQMMSCKACNSLIAAHGADPNSDAPPKFPFLENGTGQDTPPNMDRPGDSALVGEGKKNESIDLKVTAKKGTTLHFMCLIHPWMQAQIKVK